MKINPDAVEQLTALRNTIKFQPEEPNDRKPLGYMGLLPEQNRPLANDILNHSIDKILEVLRSKPSKKRILQAYKTALEQFEEIFSDTEDRECV